MMSVESEICRRAALIHPIRSRYHSGVYSRAIASSTRAEPDCTGRCTWSQSVGTRSIASTISRVKSRGWLVMKRTRRMPGTSPTAASNSAKLDFPSGSR